MRFKVSNAEVWAYVMATVRSNAIAVRELNHRCDRFFESLDTLRRIYGGKRGPKVSAG